MSETTNLQKKLKRLSDPYKVSSAYKKYGEPNKDCNNASSFWKAKVGYVVKYEYEKI